MRIVEPMREGTSGASVFNFLRAGPSSSLGECDRADMFSDEVEWMSVEYGEPECSTKPRGAGYARREMCRRAGETVAKKSLTKRIRCFANCR